MDSPGAASKSEFWTVLSSDPGVFSHILSWLSLKEIAKCGLVNKTFYSATKNPVLWRRLSRDNSDFPHNDKTISKVLTEYSGTVVDVELDCRNIGPSTYRALTSCKDLRSIAFYAPVQYGTDSGTTLEDESLKDIVQSCPRLQSLSCGSGTRIGDGAATAIAQLKELRSIRIPGAQLNSTSYEAIIANCDHLHTLELGDAYTANRKVRSLSCKGKAPIRRLSLDCFPHIKSLEVDLSKLEELEISGSELEVHSLTLSCPSLQSLSLYKTLCTDQDLIRLADSVPRLTKFSFEDAGRHHPRWSWSSSIRRADTICCVLSSLPNLQEFEFSTDSTHLKEIRISHDCLTRVKVLSPQSTKVVIACPKLLDWEVQITSSNMEIDVNGLLVEDLLEKEMDTSDNASERLAAFYQQLPYKNGFRMKTVAEGDGGTYTMELRVWKLVKPKIYFRHSAVDVLRVYDHGDTLISPQMKFPLCKSVEFTHLSRLSDLDWITFVSAANKLESLTLNDCQGISSSGYTAISERLQHLKRLRVYKAPSTLTDSTLKAMLGNMPNLEELHLDSCLGLISPEISHPNLRRLSLIEPEEKPSSGCTNNTNSNLCQLVQPQVACPKVEEIKIRSQHILNNSVMEYITNRCPSVQNLVVEVHAPSCYENMQM